MPGAVTADVQPSVERDDLDDIFNYDAGIDATFNQPGQDWSAQDDANNNGTNRQQHDVPENIDEEVKVTKKRKPVAKLDEERYVPDSNTFTPTTNPSIAFYPNKAFQNFERSPRIASSSRAKATNSQIWHASSTPTNYGSTICSRKQSLLTVYL